jgi:hypothetical protein
LSWSHRLEIKIRANQSIQGMAIRISFQDNELGIKPEGRVRRPGASRFILPQSARSRRGKMKQAAWQVLPSVSL